MAASLSGQSGDGSQWNTIPLDASGATIAKRSNSFTVQQATGVLLFSGIVQNWTWIDASPSAIVTAQNEHSIVEDLPTIHGWSCRTGEVDTITVGATGYVVPGPSSANYTVLVHDGTTVWGYGAQVGRWEPLTLATATPTIELGRSCAFVYDGSTAYAFSPYFGTWEPLTLAAAPISMGAEGHLAWANSATELRIFAADTNAWQTLTVLDTTDFNVESDYAVLVEGETVTAFSCFRGIYDSVTASAPGFTVEYGSHVVAFNDPDGSTVTCYSAHQGNFASITMQSALLDVGSDFVIVDSAAAGEAVAFSGPRGTFSDAIRGSYTFSRGTSVAFAEGTSTDNYAYSAVLNKWVVAPSVAYTSVNRLSSSVILAHPAGFSAFGARYDRWFELTPHGTGVLQPTSTRAAIAVVSDASQIHAWDARLGRWASATVPVGSLGAVEAEFGTVMAWSNTTAYAYGIYDGAWDTVSIHGTIIDYDPGSGVGFVQTDDFLHVYSRSGSFSTAAAYPETSQPQYMGTDLQMSQIAPEGSSVTMGVDFDPAYRIATGSVLFLNRIRWTYPMPAVPAGGLLEATIPVPGHLLLQGRSLHLQNRIVPPGGVPYLTNSISIVAL